MSKFRNYILFIIMLAAFAAIIGSRAKAWSDSDQTTAPANIQLAEISKNIRLLTNERVKFRCRFATSGNMFRKNDKTFTPDKFENFSVWEDKIRFWDNAEVKTVYPTMYIAKEKSDLVKKIRVLQRFSEIEITGVIENNYANMPWIKVENIEILDNDELDQTMVSQIRRAAKFIDNNEFQKAKICFEIALERKAPEYVNEYISIRQNSITQLTKQQQVQRVRQHAENMLKLARTNAKEKKYEKAATAYGKALKVSTDYQNSAAVHKEIAGFFIDFYKASNNCELLDYSIREFNKAAELSTTKDSDILYALAYIESIKAKTTGNFTKAEQLAKECVELNSLHYGGRKLLTEIMTAQLVHKNGVIRKPVTKTKPAINEIDSLLDTDDLFAMDDEIEDISKSLHKANIKMVEIKQTLDPAVETISKNEELVQGITAADFKGLLEEEDIIINTESDFDKAENDLINTVLPDFPISSTPNNPRLPDLAL